MQHYLISLLIFTPLVAACVCLFLPKKFERAFRIVSLVASIQQVLWLLPMLTGFQSDSGFQFIESVNWITLSLGSWGVLKAEYLVGVDGMSLPLVALSVFVLLIANISSWSIRRNVKGYFILLLILNAAVIGSFVA